MDSGHASVTLVSNETFNFREIHFDDPKVTGAQVANAFGAHPVEDFLVLAQLQSGELETLRPTETVDLKNASRFFVIEGDGTKRFVVDGLNLEWPRDVVTGLTIKCLVGNGNEDVELLLERENQADKVIEDEDEVHLDKSGVEKFHTRKVSVTIVVNTREKPWAKKKISFQELVLLAYPVPPPGTLIVYTITYFDGPPHHPEGTLTRGESVKVKDRMVFSVKFTDKS